MSKDVLDLYSHNLRTYSKILDSIDAGERIMCILQATGTGKSLISLKLSYDNQDKNILFLVPYKGIIEHLKQIIINIPNVGLDTTFKHVRFMTYSKLVSMSRKELKDLNIDILILDEFHHIGAPVWGERVKTIIETHPESLVFGMSAYSVRDRGTAYERDLAEPNSDEIFSDKVVSRYDLIDAMLDGVLPVPIYKSVCVYDKLLSEIDKLSKSKKNKTDYNKYERRMHDIKRRISETESIGDVILRNVKVGDKFIYFCPPVSDNGVNDIDTIMANVRKMFINLGYRDEDLLFYKTTSYMEDGGKESRKRFYYDQDMNGNDASNKLRIMFAINQYNEGIHAPNVNGVFLGRETSSDNIFFEHIGRSLSVRGDTQKRIKELQKLSLEEIIEMCKCRNIKINDGFTKDDMIERLVAPIIIDLVGNYSYMRDLITQLKHRMREYYDQGSEHIKRIIKLTENSYDIEIIGEDILNLLLDMRREFLPSSFSEIYKLACAYYAYYGNLNICRSFKTLDGINPNVYGYGLGEWICYLRRLYKTNKLSNEKIELLNKIGMVWSTKKSFKESLLYCSEYVKTYGNLDVPYNYVTDDNYSLGGFIAVQRTRFKQNLLSKNEFNSLAKLGMIWKKIYTWKDSYKVAKSYFDIFGDINDIDNCQNFIPSDLDLRKWVSNQKKLYSEGKLSEDKITLLEKLGIIWDYEKKDNNQLTWDQNFNLAKNYYDTFGDLEVPRSFKTFDGFTYNKEGYNLGLWVNRQKDYYRKNRLSKEQIELLESIHIRWILEEHKSFMDVFNLVYNYYLKYNNLAIPVDFKTNDGITYSSDGYNIGSWISIQRIKYKKGKLTQEQIDLLDSIGMIWNINCNYKRIKDLMKEFGINPRRYAQQVKNLSAIDFECKLRYLLSLNLPLCDKENLNSIFNMSYQDILVNYGISREDLISNYYIGMEKNK